MSTFTLSHAEPARRPALRRLGRSIAALGFAFASLAQAQTETVRIADYPGIGNFLARIAVAHKLCDKHGIRCEPRTFPSAPVAMQTLLAGDIEVAWTPPEVFLQAVAKGASLKVIGSGATSPVFFLLAGNHLETPNAAKGYPAVMRDLAGKKVGVVARGSSSEFQLITLLQGAGMKADDVTIVAVGAPNTALPALTGKQVDAMMLFQPMPAFCEVLKVCRLLVDPGNGEGPPDIVKLSGAAVALVVRGDYAQKKAAALDALGKAMREADQWAHDPANLEAVRKLANETFNIDVPQAAAVVDAMLTPSLPNYRFSLDPKALQHAAEYLHRSGQIDRVVDTSTLLDLR